MIVREISLGRVFCTGHGFVGSCGDPDDGKEVAEEDPGDFFPEPADEAGPDDEYPAPAMTRATGWGSILRKHARKMRFGFIREMNARQGISLRNHRKGACGSKAAHTKLERRRPVIVLKITSTPSGTPGYIG